VLSLLEGSDHWVYVDPLYPQARLFEYEWRFTGAISYHLNPVPILEFYMNGQWYQPIDTEFQAPNRIYAGYGMMFPPHANWRINRVQENIAFGDKELWHPQQGVVPA
jgi:hypothetical protein